MPLSRRSSTASAVPERKPVRRLFGVFLIVSSLALLAATPPPPTPTPAPVLPPVPVPTGPTAPPAALQPTLVVYPFDVQGGLDPKLGVALAQIMQQTMQQVGGITVLDVPQNVVRANFLQYARDNHAQFYISGYATPVGAGASVVEQVVSVESGVILFSQTAQVLSLADVASQALLARGQILAFVGRTQQSIQTTNTATPAPTSTNGAQVNIKGIGGIVDSVFNRRHATPTPAPTPVVKPSRGAIVAPVTASGSVPAADLTNASNELYFAMNRAFNASITTNAAPVAQAADAICGTNRNNTIATGTLAHVVPHKGKPTYTFTLSVYACFGAVLATQTGSGPSIKAAVDGAVAAYVAAHPDNS